MAIKRSALGKGLDSIIPEKFDTKKNQKEIVENTDNVSRETFVKINSIEPNRMQPRKNFNEDAIQELADSIKQFGVIQPLILQKKENNFEIIAGERRWRAARIAGLKEVPAIIKEYSTQEIITIALIENIQREDLNPIEEAMAYKKLITDYNLKQDEVASRVSKSRTNITNCMRLLKLEERVQEMLIEDMISSGHARALISVENKEEQFQFAQKIFDEQLSVRDTEKMIKVFLAPKKKKNLDEKDKISPIIYNDMEERIKTVLGTKVMINSKNNKKGKIEIEYYSTDDLERIIDLFMTIKD